MTTLISIKPGIEPSHGNENYFIIDLFQMECDLLLQEEKDKSRIFEYVSSDELKTLK